jgi:hypothetical protein
MIKPAAKVAIGWRFDNSFDAPEIMVENMFINNCLRREVLPLIYCNILCISILELHRMVTVQRKQVKKSAIVQHSPWSLNTTAKRFRTLAGCGDPN